jgi:L-aminopeptidase/D-esterase-like protein
MRKATSITNIAGLRLGHADDRQALTGCTVLLPPEGTVGGFDRRGGANGSRQLDPLGLTHVVQEVHAVLLAGGSAFGLEAATGVASFLEEQGVGFDVTVAKVPIVPTAILFDLGLGEVQKRPDAAMGRAACEAANSEAPAQGCVGAGMGATLGKALGLPQAMKSGFGSAAVEFDSGLIVGAAVAANPLGDVIDPETGAIVAGARVPGESGPVFADARAVLAARAGGGKMGFASADNTVIGAVVTNGRLNKNECTLVAQMAQDGIARAVRPAHTQFDGDTVFALATGELEVEATIVGTFAAEMVAQSIMNAVRRAEALGGLPAWVDFQE